MKRILQRLKTWCRRRREEVRAAALASKFKWLEEECLRSGEYELGSLVRVAWEARCQGQQAHGLVCLMSRDRIQVGVELRAVPVRESELRLWP